MSTLLYEIKNIIQDLPQNRKAMIAIVIIAIIPIMFLTETCSCYKYKTTMYDENNKPIIEYKFTKPNIYAVQDSLKYLFEGYKAEEEEFTQKHLDIELSKLEPYQEVLIRDKIKEKKIKNLSSSISLAPTNLFYLSNSDKEYKKLKKVIRQRNDLKKDKEKLLATSSKDTDEKVLKDIEIIDKKIEKIEKEVPIKNIKLIKKAEKIAQKEKEEERKDTKTEIKYSEKEFKTYKLKMVRLGRLKSGLCFETLPCFNGPGKDYNFIKSPNSNLHYFLSDRISPKIQPKENQFGILSIFVINGTPTTNQYEPIFTEPSLLKIPNIDSNILGFTIFHNKNTANIHLIFSANFKLYESTSIDGINFSTPTLLLNKPGAQRDPTISRDGMILIYADQLSQTSMVNVLIRDSLSTQFNDAKLIRISESEERSGYGLFPSIIEKEGRTFILYQSSNKMYSAELVKEMIYPSVEISGHIPSKYFTTFNNVFAASYFTESNNFDLALYNIEITETVVKKYKQE